MRKTSLILGGLWTFTALNVAFVMTSIGMYG
jgi:hypothetical protein